MNVLRLDSACKVLGDMYLRGESGVDLARKFGKHPHWIYRRLRKMGIAVRDPQCKGIKCVDCDKEVTKTKRCKLHTRLRLAELRRDYHRERLGIPEERWRVED